MCDVCVFRRISDEALEEDKHAIENRCALVACNLRWFCLAVIFCLRLGDNLGGDLFWSPIVAHGAFSKPPPEFRSDRVAMPVQFRISISAIAQRHRSAAVR